MNRYLLGIDVGTTGTKTMLFSADGAEKVQASAGYATNMPRPGYSEQNAEDWWRALNETVREVMRASGVRPKDVAALSLSSQGGTMVAVDGQLRPLRPAIVWNDRRCERQRIAFAERFGARYMYERSGWGLTSGLNAMAVAWMRENEPELFSRAAGFLSVPDYLSAKLTGRAVIDISDAGINQMADIRNGAYDAAILDFCQIGAPLLPEIVRSGDPIGRLTEGAARELGLHRDTRVVAGAHDQYAGLLGAGVLDAGDALIGTGTTWVVTALSDRHNFDKGFTQSVPAVAGKWGNLASIYTGGACLEWLRHGIFHESGAVIPHDALTEMAMQSAPGAKGLLFYPHFRGSGFPREDAVSKASLLGLDLSHDRRDIVRAVMEGVACQIAWAVEVFQDAFEIRRFKMAGGATKSALWTGMVANLVGKPISIPEIPDLTCVGAAILAGVGAGVYRDAREGYRQLAIAERAVDPDERALEPYRALFDEYKRQAPRLQEIYAQRAKGAKPDGAD